MLEHQLPRTTPRAIAAAAGICVPLAALLAGTAAVSTLPPAVQPAAVQPTTTVVPVAGVVPVGLALPDRGLTAPVLPTGTGPDGALAIPDDPSTVGWWAPGALAGAATGTTVLAGHVDTAAAGLGVLAVLQDVGPGERVVLQGTDGRTVAYRVVARRQHPKAELPPEIFAAGGPHRLVLVTCGGRFDRTARHYSDNVVVHAVPA